MTRAWFSRQSFGKVIISAFAREAGGADTNETNRDFSYCFRRRESSGYLLPFEGHLSFFYSRNRRGWVVLQTSPLLVFLSRLTFLKDTSWKQRTCLELPLCKYSPLHWFLLWDQTREYLKSNSAQHKSQCLPLISSVRRSLKISRERLIVLVCSAVCICRVTGLASALNLTLLIKDNVLRFK